MINLKNEDIEKIIERKIDEKMHMILEEKGEPMPPRPKDDIKPPKPKELDLKSLLEINFTDDFEKLLEIFNDEDTVIGVISTLQNCPEEIQVVAKIALDLHKKVDLLGSEEYEN